MSLWNVVIPIKSQSQHCSVLWYRIFFCIISFLTFPSGISAVAKLLRPVLNYICMRTVSLDLSFCFIVLNLNYQESRFCRFIFMVTFSLLLKFESILYRSHILCLLMLKLVYSILYSFIILSIFTAKICRFSKVESDKKLRRWRERASVAATPFWTWERMNSSSPHMTTRPR